MKGWMTNGHFKKMGGLGRNTSFERRSGRLWVDRGAIIKSAQPYGGRRPSRANLTELVFSDSRFHRIYRHQQPNELYDVQVIGLH